MIVVVTPVPVTSQVEVAAQVAVGKTTPLTAWVYFPPALTVIVPVIAPVLFLANIPFTIIFLNSIVGLERI